MLCAIHQKRFGIAATIIVLLAGLFLATGLVYARAEEQRNKGTGGPALLSSAPPSPRTSAQTCTIQYTYDAAGRLTSANYGNSQVLVYTYDPAGNLLGIADHFGLYLPLVLKSYP